MQKSKFLIFFTLLWLENVTPTFGAPNASQNLHYTEDALILQKCLIDRGGKDLQKVTNFANWNNGEEVPCFSHCLSVAKGWFNATESKWIKQEIVTDLGEDLWKYCKYELERTHDNECEFVHKGFRCLRKAEENTRQTYMTLLNCAIGLGSDLNELQKYSNFNEQEQIPCLFKCFAEVTDLYNPNFEWNFANWTKAFGPFDVEGAALSCRTNEEQKTESACAWMYREYLCLEQLGANASKSLETTTMINTQNRERTISEVVQESMDHRDNSSTIEIGTTSKTVDHESFEFQYKNITQETNNSTTEIVRESSDLLDKNITKENIATATANFPEGNELQGKNKTIQTDATVVTAIHESIEEKIETKSDTTVGTTVQESIERQIENNTIEIDVRPATIALEGINLQDQNKTVESVRAAPQ